MAKHELDDGSEILHFNDNWEEVPIPESSRYGWYESIKGEYTKSLRNKRNVLLLESDWTQAVDSPLSDSDKAEWVTYRQALRDITLTYWREEDTVWPTKP